MSSFLGQHTRQGKIAASVILAFAILDILIIIYFILYH